MSCHSYVGIINSSLSLVTMRGMNSPSFISPSSVIQWTLRLGLNEIRVSKMVITIGLSTTCVCSHSIHAHTLLFAPSCIFCAVLGCTRSLHPNIAIDLCSGLKYCLSPLGSVSCHFIKLAPRARWNRTLYIASVFSGVALVLAHDVINHIVRI